jgi:signal transduction histidine kinase
MLEGGTVAIRTEADPSDAGNTVRIVVEDTGSGIPDRTKARLFEPFVSTKGEGHRGLGLSIVYSLARQMGGDVRYEPTRPTGGGARFVVSLRSV